MYVEEHEHRTEQKRTVLQLTQLTWEGVSPQPVELKGRGSASSSRTADGSVSDRSHKIIRTSSAQLDTLIRRLQKTGRPDTGSSMHRVGRNSIAIAPRSSDEATN
jgi:hypothetical protein